VWSYFKRAARLARHNRQPKARQIALEIESRYLHFERSLTALLTSIMNAEGEVKWKYTLPQIREARANNLYPINPSSPG
jgi:hypothetical protein